MEIIKVVFKCCYAEKNCCIKMCSVTKLTELFTIWPAAQHEPAGASYR